MPSRLNSPVITVDMNHISKVDPSNVDNLFSMWTIFSKCAESLENGRRLENLSWRLWNRETFCCDDAITRTQPTPIRKTKSIDSDSNYSDIPELSTSVDSAPSEDELPKDRSDSVGSSRPCIIRGDSMDRYRGKEKHMTPVHLARIMEDIDRNKSSAEDWMSQRRKCAPTQPRKVSSLPEQPTADMAGPESSLRSTHSVVRGFSPGRISSSYRSTVSVPMAVPSPVKVSVTAPIQKKSKPVFYLGSSTSSHSDDDDDLEDSYTRHRGSGGRSSFKRTSFKDNVATRTVIDDEYATTDDDISESAIEEDDDDASDWESSAESLPNSYEEKAMFKRVESKPNLSSRRSLLSTMLHEPQRAAQMQSIASRSTPAIRRSPRAQPGMPPPREETTSGMTPARPIIMTTSNTHPPALSPRTTRRNMLATELTESLRKHLLWERQQKNTTASAHLKRRHTTQDVTKLTDYPMAAHLSKGNTSKNNSWNNYFDHQQHEYHATGW